MGDGQIQLHTLFCAGCGFKYWVGLEGDICPKCSSTHSVGNGLVDWVHLGHAAKRGEIIPENLLADGPE